MSIKTYSIACILLLSSTLLFAQEEKMPFGTSSSYSVELSKPKANKDLPAVKSVVVFQENFDSYDSNFDTYKWEVKRSSNISGTDLTDATTPKWFLCKPSNFSGNGGTYIHSGTRSAAIAFTAPNFTWLIGKEPITIFSENVTLSFWIYYYNNASQDIITNFHVLISEVGNESWQVLRSWNEESANNQYQQKVSISLADYAEKIVQIAFVFENQEDGGYQLAIDDISVGVIDSPLLTLSAIPFDFSSVPSILIETVDLGLGVKIQNSGLEFNDTATLQAIIEGPFEVISYASLLVTDTIKEGSSMVYSLEDTTDYSNQGLYWITYMMYGENIEYYIQEDTISFNVSNNLFATDYGILGGFSLGNGKHVGNLYPIKKPVLASAIQIGWSSFPGGTEPIPFGVEIYEVNPMDSTLSSIYYKELQREPTQSNQYTSYLIDNTYLSPGAQYFVAVKQLSSTPLGIAYDMEYIGHFWSLNTNGKLERFANPSFGNLGIRLMISPASENNFLNITVTDGENPIQEALIQIDEHEDVLTNAEGKASIGLENGNYIYKIVKEGYAEVVDTVKILYASVNRTIVLEPEYLVKITLSSAKSPISGVQILVSGKSTITNNDGVAEVYLTAGVHILTAMLSGYIPVVQEIEVTESGNEFIIEMEPGVSYVATFTIVDELEKPVENVRVTITDLGFKFTNNLGIITFSGLLPANDISYTLFKHGFNSLSSTFSISDSDVEISNTLNYMKYNVVFEVTNGEIPLYNAIVKLEGYGSVSTNFSGLTQITDVIPSDSISFTVTKSGYATYRSHISVDDSNVRVSIVLSPATSVPFEEKGSLLVYPNPNSGVFTVVINSIFDAQVFDLTGRLVHSENNADKSLVIDISQYPSGIYILKVASEKDTKTLKIVKR